MAVIKVDNTPDVDGRKSIKAQISDIQQAKEVLSKQNSILQQNVDAYTTSSKDIEKTYKDFNDAIKVLTNNINTLNKDSQSKINDFLKTIGLSEKQLQTFSTEYDRTALAFKKMTKEGNATGEQFVDTVQSMSEMNDELGSLSGLLNKVIENFGDLNDETKVSIRQKSEENRLARDEQRRTNEKFKSDYLRNQKVAGESLGKAIKGELENFQTGLKGIIDTLNLSALTSQLAPSAKQQLQGDIQTNFNLSARGFEQFKHQLYDQIDTSIYTVDEVNNAIATLNTTALGNTQTATKYFNDIIRGQKALGISSEAQQALLKLGNLTGRNELSFYQGTVAKFLNSNLGLNKQQLNELVSLNANFAQQAADLGITSEAFQEMQMKTTAALEATQTGAGAKLVQAEQALLTNTDTTAALLGMTSAQYQANLENGIGLPEMLLNSNAGSAQAIAAIRSGDTERIGNMREWASNAWGADSEAIWSVLNILAKKEDEFNKNYQTVTEAAMQDAQEAMKTEEQKQTESLTKIQEILNTASNWLNDKIPWSVEATLKSISVGVYAILAAMSLGGNIKNIGKALFNGGKLSGGLTGLGGGAAIAGGVLWGVSDAMAMQGSENTSFGSSARGFFLGTGSKEKTAGQNALSVGGNTAKYALIGAGIGSFIPGLGTAAGAGIGALVGLTTGLLGTARENKKLQEEQNEKLDAVEQNTATTAANTAKDSLGMVYRYRGTDNWSSASGAIGSISGGGYRGHIARGPIGAMEDAGKPITSYWMQRRTYTATDGKTYTDVHNGADFGVPEGTALYSNATGTVTMNFTEKSGANIVGVTDSAGYTHLYAHMRERSPLPVGTPVNKGQFIGYSGKTGKVTGAHLHYTVLRPGEDARKNYWVLSNTVDPGPFVSSSIFNGDASSIVSSSNKTVANSNISDVIGAKTSLINLDKIGGISGPIVGSITDLKQTIIDLSNKTDRNEKILNMLTNKATPSPIA